MILRSLFNNDTQKCIITMMTEDEDIYRYILFKKNGKYLKELTELSINAFYYPKTFASEDLL